MARFTNLRLSAAFLAVAVLCTGSLTAQANLIHNGSFEDTTVNNASYWVTASGNPNAISDWTVTQGNSMVINDNDSTWVFHSAEEGHQFWLASLIYHDETHTTTEQSTLTQTFATESGKTYDVSFYYAFLDATRYGLGAVTALLSYDVGGTPTTLAIAADTPWTKETFQFTATGPTTTLSFSGGAGLGTTYPGPNLDNVVVTAHIPEPSTMLLLLSGLAGLLAYAWRKRR